MVKDKTAQIVTNLLMNEDFPRFGVLLELMIHNGPENVNEVIRQTVESLNLYITVYANHPQSHTKLKRFHQFLGAFDAT